MKVHIQYFLITLGALTAIVASCLIYEQQKDLSESHKVMSSFQEIVGGIGLGAVVVPVWNFSEYDPRLEPVPEDILYPIPGGYSFAPDRLTTVSSFPATSDKRDSFQYPPEGCSL